LFGQADQTGSEDGVGGFQRGAGGESPARSTLSLIFDGLNVSLGSPIDIGQSVSVIDVNGVVG